MRHYQEADGCDFDSFKTLTRLTNYEIKQSLLNNEIGLWFLFTEEIPLRTVIAGKEIDKTGWFKVRNDEAVKVVNADNDSWHVFSSFESLEGKHYKYLSLEDCSANDEYEVASAVIDFENYFDRRMALKPEWEGFKTDSRNINIYSKQEDQKLIEVESGFKIQRKELFFLPHDLEAFKKKSINREFSDEKIISSNNEHPDTPDRQIKEGWNDMAEYCGCSARTLERWNERFRDIDGKKVIKGDKSSGRWAHNDGLDLLKRKAKKRE